MGSPEANRTDASSAIVWAIGTANSTATDGTLEAFDAIPQASCGARVAVPCLPMIWSAPVGNPAKFSMSATDHGRVYVGTADGHLLGFGVRGQARVGKAVSEPVPVGSGLSGSGALSGSLQAEKFGTGSRVRPVRVAVARGPDRAPPCSPAATGAGGDEVPPRKVCDCSRQLVRTAGWRQWQRGGHGTAAKSNRGRFPRWHVRQVQVSAIGTGGASSSWG